jgi:hypothetical protein
MPAPRFGPARTAVRIALVSLLAAIAIGAGTVEPFMSTRPADAASTTVTGRVYQDFNSDGTLDSTVAFGQAADIGVGGIAVRAFGADGVLVGSATTAANGTWSIDVATAPTADVRIEFSIPRDDAVLGAYESSFAAETGASGSTRGTSVQFARAGDIDVDYAINVPSEFCQSNPNLAISRQCLGGEASDAGAPTIWVTRYDGGPHFSANGYSNLYVDWSATSAASIEQTGSILGMAWNPITRRVISSSYVRRLVPLYESGGQARPAALFSTVPAATNNSATGGTTAFLVDLEELLPGDQFSNTTPPTAGVANAGFTGYIPTNAARKVSGLNNSGSLSGPQYAIDADIVSTTDGVYEEVGKTGIGDIDIDESGDLWVVSLYTGHLYRVAMPVDGSAPTAMDDMGAIGTPVSCTNGDPRPFGATAWRDAIYLGVVCDGSRDFSPTAPAAANDDTNLTVSVVRYNPVVETFTAFAGPFALSNGGQFKGTPTDNTTFTRWNPWTDIFSTAWDPVGFWAAMYPTPMASDIQFDRDGSMVISVRDRSMDQSIGSSLTYPDGSSNAGQQLAAGDIYRVCRTGSGWTNADYVFEGATGCPKKHPNYVAVATDDEWYLDDYGTTLYGHGETSSGMLEQVPGFPEVLNTAFDPYQPFGADVVTPNTWSSGGVSYFVNTTGGRNGPNGGGGVIFYSNSGAANSIAPGGFAKGNGMADVEALCDAAPLQIGDRLWLDADGDGVQDPGEPPLVGVTVRLYDLNGVLVSTAKTDSSGLFRFSSNVTEPSNGGGASADASGGNLAPNTGYTIAIDNPDDYAPGGPLDGVRLTSSDATTDEESDVDGTIDSDATLETGTTFGVDRFPVIAVAPLAPGVNDHTYDIGFVPLVAVGDRVWIDDDRNGIQDDDEEPLEGVLVELLDVDGEPVLDVFGNPAQATTDSNGNYVIDGLLPGTYRARFTLPAGYVFTIVGEGDAVSDSNPDRLTGITEPFDVAGAVNADTIADTSSSTVAIFVNPTIDAGVVRIVSLGDYVWLDSNRDGIQDNGEPGIAGVTLSITYADGSPVVDVFGNPVTTTVTDADGYYSFDNLPVGTYTVTVTPPAGLVPTRAASGTVDTDSSTDAATSISLRTNGQRDASLDFGFVVPAVSVGDFVWLDLDRDGVQDAGERGIAGVILTITRADGSPVVDVFGNPVTTTVTDADGRYSFDNLPVGRYRVMVTTPTGMIATGAALGGDNALDSSTRRARSILLTADGERDATLDFGFVVPAVSVGDFVWLDLDRDGIQDAGERGIAGVTLTITRADGSPVVDVFGNPVTTTVTDADGRYSFDNLPPGDYVVRLAIPDGYVATTPTDMTSVGLTSDGAADTALDFGVVRERPGVVLPRAGSALIDVARIGLLMLGVGLVVRPRRQQA